MTDGTMLDRAVLRLAGDDVRGFLQGLVTQDVALVQPEAPQWSGLLTPQGKALFDFLLWADGDDVLVDAERDQAEALARRLTLYRLRRAITIAATPLRVHWSRAPGRGVPDPRLPALGHRWLAQDEALPATDWLRHRLSLGVTEGVAELGQDATLWLEANARELNGVGFAKGCYVGQENTARMHYRATVNRRLVVVPLDSAGEQARARYPALGWAVERRRIDALGEALRPAWLFDALAEDAAAAAQD